MSHPTWVCGLKHNPAFPTLYKGTSHPTWVCGLKRALSLTMKIRPQSHPTWVCGLKLSIGRRNSYNNSHTLRGCVD